MSANATKKSKKLELKRETLRRLTAKEASAVAGNNGSMASLDTQGGGPVASGAMVCFTGNCPP